MAHEQTTPAPVPVPTSASDTLETYRDKLRDHDWTFEYSDDARVWRAGSKQLSELRVLQKQLDPKYEIWNQHAPKAYRR